MNFESAAKEIFRILRQFNYELVLFDDEGNEVNEPEQARRFYDKDDNLLTALVDKGDDGVVRVVLSNSKDIESVIGLLEALRTMATKYNITFNVRKSDKEKFTPKDFSTQASVNEQKEFAMNILEGMYGTSRSSYLKLENARMIVRHTSRINENSLGARGRNIDSIYIENSVGERYLFPTTQLAPARAMTHHVDNGGSWADPVGEQIARMAQDFAHLGAASRHIYAHGGELTESAHDLRNTIRECMREMRRTFESVCRKTRYDETVKALSEMATTLVEGDYSAKINELASMLNTESVSLSENVLSSVAKVLEDDKRFKLSNERKMETTSILGKELRAAGIELDEVPGANPRGLTMNKAAWDDFLKNNIDFTSPVELATKGSFKGHGAEVAAMPKFKDPMAEHVFKLRAVAEKCRDDSMANLLGFIAEHRPTINNKALAQIFDVIANKAFKIAGINGAKNENAVAAAPAIVEFQQWIQAFSTEKALLEYDRFQLPDGSEFDHQDTVNDIVNNFDYNEFMASPSAEDFMYDQKEILSDEEKTFAKDQAISAIEKYLESSVEDFGFQGVDLRSDAEHIYDRVVGPALREDGYIERDNGVDLPMAAESKKIGGEETLEENPLAMIGAGAAAAGRLAGGAAKAIGGAAKVAGNMFGGDEEVDENCGKCIYDDADMEDAELSQEDVLLPKNPTNDLKGEVTPSTVTDPETGKEMEPDNSYTDRLIKLAGIRR